MRTVNSFGLFFYPRLVRAKDGIAPLMVRITANKDRKDLSLKYRIPIDRWHSEKQLVKGADIDAKNLNKYIAEVKAELHNCYRQLQIDKKLISAQAIKSKFLGEDAEEKTLMDVINYHSTIMKDHLQPGTTKNYWTTQKYLKEFLKQKLKTDDVFLKQLNYKFLADFDDFLRHRTPDEHQRPCTNNGVMKHIQRLRKMVNMAIMNDWLKFDPFIRFKPTYVKKDRGYLNEEELQKIETKNILHENTCIIRDLFIFSCYTGLAYSDAKNLTAENLHKGIDGEIWIIVNRQKTGVQANIPLLPQAEKIIEKYKNHPKSLNRDKLLPMLSNQRFNSYLKAIAEFCGVTKNLTHHLARHTFATTVCLNNGISMEATSGMLGHTSVRTTQIYGRILPKLIGKEMANLRAKLQDRNTSTSEEIKTGS